MDPDFSEDADFGENHQVIDQSKSRPLWQKILFLVIVLALLAGAIFGISKLFQNSKKENNDKTATSSAETNTATESASASTTQKRSKSCTPDQDFTNTQQGYSVCYLRGWVEKELRVSGLDIGIAPKANEPFSSTLEVYITDQSADLVIQTFNDTSSKFEFGTDSIDGTKVTQTTITRMKSDPLSAVFPRAILTATTTHNRTYVAILNSSDTDFTVNQTIYTNFLKSWEFLSDIPKPPWSSSHNIIVNQPWTGDKIANPVKVSGEALAFEAVVNFRLKDANGTVLKETTLQTKGGSERSAFAGEVSYDRPKTKTGTLEVYTVSAKDSSEQDKVSIPVKF